VSTSSPPSLSSLSSLSSSEGDGLGLGPDVGDADGLGGGVAPLSRITIVSRTGGSSAADATSDPATNAPSGSTRARGSRIFHSVRMTPPSCPIVGRE
jgi:hypothetical protein